MGDFHPLNTSHTEHARPKGLLCNAHKLLISHLEQAVPAADNFEKRMDQRLNEQRDLLRSELYRFERVLDARLKHLEENLH